MKITATSTATTVRIKAAYNYYPGTCNAPQDGYLMGHPTYDGFTGRESCAPLDFASVADAYAYLANDDESSQDAMFCEYDGAGDFSRSGQHVTRHGQHSRPVYTIVAAKSGRCTKAIIAACDALNA